jgi:NADPH:quinone reductase-like Zn-dependent oxidoreductase
MKAIAHDGFGPPDDLRVREIDKPQVGDVHGVLIRVRAASVNPLDWHLMRGEPSFMRMMAGRRPVGRIPGADVAGEVEAVGAKVIQFRAGDQVFGTCRGAFAEYARSTENNLASKPAGLTWEQAASIPVAGCTALQAVRDRGGLQPGHRALINGAAGGVGTFAVQIAKALGGEVTGVCSTRNLELVRSIGADHVVDYTAEDFTRGDRRYDLIVHLAGTRSRSDMRRALTPRGAIVVVGGGTGRQPDDDQDGGLLEIVTLMMKGHLLSRFVRPRESMFMARIRQADLNFVAQLIEARKLTPVIDRTYPLAETAEAIRHLETGHARGKVIVTI